jgi:uncharacterized membrane protein (UPF0127 family)
MMNSNKIFLIIIFLGAFLGIFLLGTFNKIEFSKVVLGEKTLNLEIVSSSSDRSRGLSERKLLPEDKAMLFVFPKEDFHGIWMKEMNFPIDILWLDEKFEIVDIKKDARPESFPEVFKPKTKSLYVLEINAGFSEKEEIGVGQSLEFF